MGRQSVTPVSSAREAGRASLRLCPVDGWLFPVCMSDVCSQKRRSEAAEDSGFATPNRRRRLCSVDSASKARLRFVWQNFIKIFNRQLSCPKFRRQFVTLAHAEHERKLQGPLTFVLPYSQAAVWMLLPRTIGCRLWPLARLLPLCPATAAGAGAGAGATSRAGCRPAGGPAPQQVRWGSMKVKRIQRRHPLEKNRIKRLIRGTRLEVKKPKQLHKTKRRNTDPDKYITVKPVEVDAIDLRGRSTLIVPPPCFLLPSLPFPLLVNFISFMLSSPFLAAAVHAHLSWTQASAATRPCPFMEGRPCSQTNCCKAKHRRQESQRQGNRPSPGWWSPTADSPDRLPSQRTRASDRRSNRVRPWPVWPHRPHSARQNRQTVLHPRCGGPPSG